MTENKRIATSQYDSEDVIKIVVSTKTNYREDWKKIKVIKIDKKTLDIKVIDVKDKNV